MSKSSHDPKMEQVKAWFYNMYMYIVTFVIILIFYNMKKNYKNIIIVYNP